MISPTVENAVLSARFDRVINLFAAAGSMLTLAVALTGPIETPVLLTPVAEAVFAIVSASTSACVTT